MGGFGPQAKQVNALYLCRQAWPRQGGNGHVWWTWARGKTCESAAPVQKNGPRQGGHVHVWWIWATGKAGESVVPVHRSLPEARWQWACLVDLGERQNMRKCCTCAENGPRQGGNVHVWWI